MVSLNRITYLQQPQPQSPLPPSQVFVEQPSPDMSNCEIKVNSLRLTSVKHIPFINITTHLLSFFITQVSIIDLDYFT